MKNIDKLENDVMTELLQGESDEISILRTQYLNLEIKNHEFTGVGFFTNYKIPDKLERAYNISSSDFPNVMCKMDGLLFGLGFVFFIKDGQLDFLEGYTFDEEFLNKIRI